MVVFGYRRLTDVTERRRVRVFVVGSSVGLLSVLPIVAIYWGRAPSTFGDSVFASPAAAIGSILGLALPASFAYAILRHRLFDVRLMLRLGLQYALGSRFRVFGEAGISYVHTRIEQDVFGVLGGPAEDFGEGDIALTTSGIGSASRVGVIFYFK